MIRLSPKLYSLNHKYESIDKNILFHTIFLVEIYLTYIYIYIYVTISETILKQIGGFIIFLSLRKLIQKNRNSIEIFFMADDLMLLEIRKNLKEQQIEYQIKIINNNLRLSLNNLDGQYISLNRDKNIKNYYKILFKKEDEKKIKNIFSQYNI